ncbi:MAG: DNA recombination protein RmuC [Flavobacteriales bacterium]|nr:DNA recombination protein RmuC [Flavobacteriales bacterium]
MDIAWIILLSVLMLGTGYLIAYAMLYKPQRDRWQLMHQDLSDKLQAASGAAQSGELEITRLKSELANTQKELDRRDAAKEEMDKKMSESFELIANRILEKNSEKLQAQHGDKLKAILDPLKERIETFEQRVDRTHKDTVVQTEGLKAQILQLTELNQRLGEEARNLTAALKGDKKLQGDWGEKQLESILQSAGLTKNIHYKVQESLRDESGALFRPDVIVNMPDNKHLIIDSKVSLVAYEAYYNTDEPSEKKKHLQNFIGNIRSHFKQLSTKDYPALYGIQPPDYVLMFIPLDASLYLATVEDPGLFEEAIRQQVVLVSNTTLFATLRTISYIWQQDTLNKNTQLIARESGALYDKFVGFVLNMEKLGTRIQSVQTEYDDALGKLRTGRGNLVSKAEKLKKLGLQSKKELQQDVSSGFLDKSEIDEDPDEQID